VRAAAVIVRGAVTGVEIVVGADVRAAVDVVAGAVDVRAAVVVVEIAGVAGGLEAGAAAGGTKVRCDDFVSTTSLPRIFTDLHGSINVS
jgi:hypothetical protein